MWNVKAKLLSLYISTVKPAHAVSCIRRSHISCPVIENFIWIEPLLRGLLSYQATFSLSERWPINTGWIVNMLCLPEIISITDYFWRKIVGLLTWRKEISLNMKYKLYIIVILVSQTHFMQIILNKLVFLESIEYWRSYKLCYKYTIFFLPVSQCVF